MTKVFTLLFFAVFAASVAANPAEDRLISELKRILLEDDADSGPETTGQLDDDEEKRVKEEEITQEIADAGKMKEDEGIEGGQLGLQNPDETEQNPEETEQNPEETEQNPDVEGQLENAGEQTPDEGTELENVEEEEEQAEEAPPTVQGLLHHGWDMLDDLQRVSVALFLENNPISENKNPRDALRDALVQIFEFDGLTDKLINNLLKRLSPTTDMCSEMFSEDETRTLERVTNCFIMRFTQVLSLVERLEKVSTISELKAEDLIRLSTLERDLFRVSYEVFKILKREDPSASLPDIIGDKQAALMEMQGGGLAVSGSNSGGSEAQPPSSSLGEEEEVNGDEQGNGDEQVNGDGEGNGDEEVNGDEEGNGNEEDNGNGNGNEEDNGNEEEGGEEEGGEEVGEDDTPAADSSKRLSRKDFISRLAKRLEELIARKYEK